MRRPIRLLIIAIVVAGLVALGALGVNVPYMVSTLIVYPLSVLTSYGALTLAMLIALIYLAVLVGSMRRQLTRVEQRLDRAAGPAGGEAEDRSGGEARSAAAMPPDDEPDAGASGDNPG